MVGVRGRQTEDKPERGTLSEFHDVDFFLVGEGVTEHDQGDASADGQPETETEGGSGVSRRASR